MALGQSLHLSVPVPVACFTGVPLRASVVCVSALNVILEV